MHTQLKCIFYIYLKHICTLLFTYSYTVYMHIRYSIHASPNPCHYNDLLREDRNKFGGGMMLLMILCQNLNVLKL